MRVTVDIDSTNRFNLCWAILKNAYFLHKYPDVIKSSCTGRGYHIINYGLDETPTRILQLRRLIGDDANRVFLDMCSDKRMKQVLFTKKNVKKRYRNKKIK